MERITPRPTAGNAGGALSGEYPAPAMGTTCTMGPWLRDDFHRVITTEWTATALGGGGATATAVVPTAGTEYGVSQVVTPATTTRGSVYQRSTVADIYGCPPPGCIWTAKMVVTSGTSAYTLWSGFASGTAAPAVATNIMFVGLRSVGGNLFGVVKDGAAAGNESTVDFGFDIEGANFGSSVSAGFEVTGSVGSESIQFFRYDCSDRMNRGRTNVGSAITTNVPTGNLFSTALGIITDENVAKTVLIDYWELSGRTAR